MTTGQSHIIPAVAVPVSQIPHVADHVAPPINDQTHEGGREMVHGVDGDGIVVNVSQSSGLAVIEQLQAIPRTGKRKPTGRWEYLTFCLFYFANNAAPIGGNGAALRQVLLSQANPSGMILWGGRTLTQNALLLDISGIIFAVQAVFLLMVGPFADYGNWRPYILIGAQGVLWVMQFSLVGIHKPSQWQLANGLYVVGSLAANISVAFYQATFPSLVRDLPRIISSEHETREGTRSPDEHAKLDQYERAQLFNLCNITGSTIVVITHAISIGISHAIGYATSKALIHSYNVLLGYYGAITVICTLPFLLIQKHRPGQQVPDGVKWYMAGPMQVWSAMRQARQLKHCMLYLVAWCCLQESWGTCSTIVGILQNEVIHYSPLKLNALGLVGDLAGGLGTVMMYFLQKRFDFSVQSALRVGCIMTVIPCLYGGVGMFTHKIGFHNGWEFWLISSWNFMTGCWGAYSVTMVSEVVPAPKVMMFFAMFNTWGQTSGFIGPFISSAIIEDAGGKTNAAFWFLFSLGSIGCIILWQVDTDQAKIDNARYLEREAQEVYRAEQRARGRKYIVEENHDFKLAINSA